MNDFTPFTFKLYTFYTWLKYTMHGRKLRLTNCLTI